MNEVVRSRAAPRGSCQRREPFCGWECLIALAIAACPDRREVFLTPSLINSVKIYATFSDVTGIASC